jgi:hypothetical protein
MRLQSAAITASAVPAPSDQGALTRAARESWSRSVTGSDVGTSHV